jgi:phosphatidate phosphatase PAH1
VSLPPNSINTWVTIEQRFHDYFYSGESELRLSHLVAIKQKSNETMVDYMQRLRDTRNKCYGLTIEEKDLAKLAFAGFSMVLKDKMEGQDFVDMNQVLQCAMEYESQAKEHKTFGRFKEVTSKENPGVNLVEEDSASDEDAEVCIAEWVDTPKDKPIACSFLK